MGDDTSRYDDAVAALYSPLHQARTPEALKQSALRRTKTIEDMCEYMRRIGLVDEALPRNIIHITGTKGKGSTACMCEAILRERYDQNTGLFTSPHLVEIRERIRVNGKPISRQVFGEAYWRVRQRLEEYRNEKEELPVLPGYFRMLTLLALYVFSHYEPQIDVVILEVGMGGRYDATNILDMHQRNVVCGVTLLDLDHTRVLGNTIEEIAWEKGGIFQVNKGSTENVSKRPTYDVHVEGDGSEPTATNEDSTKRLFALDTNTESALFVLHNCAAVEGQGQKLYLVSEGQSLPAFVPLGLQGDHQRINAELAVALCESLVEGIPLENDRGVTAMYVALTSASWPGRCQSVDLKAHDGTPLNLRLDGAHTPKSLKACLLWFEVCTRSQPNEIYRVLIFNCSHERSPVELLQKLASFPFDAVYFCRADFERPSMIGKSTARELLEAHGIAVEENEKSEGETLTWQDSLAGVWKHLETDSSAGLAMITTNLNVRDAIVQIRNFRGYDQIEVLVTGSLYIVGSVLDAIEWREDVALGALVER